MSASNYQLVAANVYGEAEAEYLFGFSFAMSGELMTLAIVPIGGHDRMLYKVALENLWSNFEETNGSINGRSLALVNVRYDSDAVNAFVYV